MTDHGQSRSAQLKKVEWIKLTKQNQKQILGLEKEIKNHISSKRAECQEEFFKLSEQEVKLLEELRKEASKVSIRQKKLHGKVLQFKQRVETVDPTKPEGLEAIKTAMEDIELEIRNFKDQQRTRYDGLMREHSQLESDLDQLQQHMLTWNQVSVLGDVSARTQPRPVTTARDVNKELPPEVAAFDLFLQETGGHRGGWDEYDHGTFLKYRNKFKGRATFIAELSRALVTRSESEVREHERWYTRYLQLQEDKRQAITAWRQEKECEKEESAAGVVKREQAILKKKQQKEEEQAALKQQQDKVNKARISAWKVKKELEKAEQEEKKLRQHLEKKQVEEHQRMLQEEQRSLLSARREQRLAEEALQARQEAELRHERQRQRQQDAAAYIQRFRSRDQASTEMKLLHKQRAELEKEEKKKRLEKLKSQVAVQAERNPNRLLQATRGWEERQKADRSAAGRVYTMPHRAVPSWRQGLS